MASACIGGQPACTDVDAEHQGGVESRPPLRPTGVFLAVVGVVTGTVVPRVRTLTEISPSLRIRRGRWRTRALAASPTAAERTGG